MVDETPKKRQSLRLQHALKAANAEEATAELGPYVSRTGVFIVGAEKAAVATRGFFEITLADGTRFLRGMGVVRSNAPQSPAGVSLEFVDLDKDTEARVQSIVAKLGDGRFAPKRRVPAASTTKAAPAATPTPAPAPARKTETMALGGDLDLDSLLSGFDEATANAPKAAPPPPAVEEPPTPALPAEPPPQETPAAVAPADPPPAEPEPVATPAPAEPAAPEPVAAPVPEASPSPEPSVAPVEEPAEPAPLATAEPPASKAVVQAEPEEPPRAAPTPVAKDEPPPQAPVETKAEASVAPPAPAEAKPASAELARVAADALLLLDFCGPEIICIGRKERGAPLTHQRTPIVADVGEKVPLPSLASWLSPWPATLGQLVVGHMGHTLVPIEDGVALAALEQGGAPTALSSLLSDAVQNSVHAFGTSDIKSATLVLPSAIDDETRVLLVQTLRRLGIVKLRPVASAIAVRDGIVEPGATEGAMVIVEIGLSHTQVSLCQDDQVLSSAGVFDVPLRAAELVHLQSAMLAQWIEAMMRKADQGHAMLSGLVLHNDSGVHERSKLGTHLSKLLGLPLLATSHDPGARFRGLKALLSPGT